MNFRDPNRKDNEDSIDITPMIDVVFILLIFFMVTTTFQSESRLSVNLPKAADRTEQRPPALEIMIDASGRYFVNGRQLKKQHPLVLKQVLKEISRNQKDQPLVIRADANTPHQAVVTALDIAAQLGLVHVSIATLQQQE